jgi:hypothetical protein
MGTQRGVDVIHVEPIFCGYILKQNCNIDSSLSNGDTKPYKVVHATCGVNWQTNPPIPKINEFRSYLSDHKLDD